MADLRPNQRGIKLAVTVTNPQEVERLKTSGCIKICFMCCTIGKRVWVVCYHQYLKFGDMDKNCKIAISLSECFKFGEDDRKFAVCKKSASCFLCK